MNWPGARVEYEERQGFFSKFARPNRYLRFWAVGFGYEGLDLVTFGPNLGRRSRIGRLGGSPATANLGLPGVEKGKIWVGRHLSGTRDTTRPKAGHEQVRGGASSAGGSSARRGLPAQAVRGSPVFRRAQKAQGNCSVQGQHNREARAGLWGTTACSPR